MKPKPIMPTATAVWLVDNTSLTFGQIAVFCGLHELEVQGIADGEVAVGTHGMDPIVNHQLEVDEIKRGEGDPDHALQLMENPVAAGENRRQGPRYTPLSKRQDRPAAISWLLKHHQELTTGQISKLIGTTKNTIDSIRERTHWNSTNIQPTDPVALGLCQQIELDAAVRKAGERVAKEQKNETVDSGKKVLPVTESLQEDAKQQSPVFDLGDFSLNHSEKTSDSQ